MPRDIKCFGEVEGDEVDVGLGGKNGGDPINKGDYLQSTRVTNSNLQSGDSSLQSGDWKLESPVWRIESPIWRLESPDWRLEFPVWRLETRVSRPETGDSSLQSHK